MNSIEIKSVTPQDTEILKQVSRQTFQETFSEDNTEENMQKYLDENLSTSKLQAEINNPETGFYFAVYNGKAIGYLKLNSGKAQTELKDENALEIERIYVLREFQRMKLGQVLLEKAVEVAKERDARYIWLGVWEHNRKAISFYQKNGFEEFDRHIFKLGDDEQTDIIMKKAL